MCIHIYKSIYTYSYIIIYIYIVKSVPLPPANRATQTLSMRNTNESHLQLVKRRGEWNNESESTFCESTSRIRNENDQQLIDV